MGSFKRAFFGYSRPDVDAAVSSRDLRIRSLEQRVGECEGGSGGEVEAEAELMALSAMVIEREREIRGLNERLREANERHARSIDSLEAVSSRLEDIHAQARGQATRIRMKALREAVEVSRKVQELTDSHASEDGVEAEVAAAPEPAPGLFAGDVRLEIGPLGDFSQLVGFEDAIGQLGASEISVERFSEGRATLSMRLEEPVELVRELEELSQLEFNVRQNRPDGLILDVEDDAGPEQRAA